MTPAETWEEYRKLVLSELERFGDKAEEIDKRLDNLSGEVTTLRTKVTVVGAAVGVALAVLNIVLRFIPS